MLLLKKKTAAAAFLEYKLNEMEKLNSRKDGALQFCRLCEKGEKERALSSKTVVQYFHTPPPYFT